MSQKEQDCLQDKIAEIISGSRLGAEMFFIDFDMAAKNILAYLQKERLIITAEPVIEIQYSEQSKAA